MKLKLESNFRISIEQIPDVSFITILQKLRKIPFTRKPDEIVKNSGNGPSGNEPTCPESFDSLRIKRCEGNDERNFHMSLAKVMTLWFV